MQISDELVQYITSELLKRINKNGAGPAAPSPPAAKPLLHLVGRREDLSTPELMKIQESFEVKEHKLWEDELPREASVCITSLSLQALVRVAEGDEGCTVEGRVLLAALLNGQPVCALKDGLVWRRYQATAPPGLLAKYAHYEKTLTGYGLKLVEGSEVAEALLGRPRPAPAALGLSPSRPLPAAESLSGSSAGRRRVISENDIMAACPVAGGPGQNLSLLPGDILTPLARDYAKAMKINIVRN